MSFIASRIARRSRFQRWLFNAGKKHFLHRLPSLPTGPALNTTRAHRNLTFDQQNNSNRKVQKKKQRPHQKPSQSPTEMGQRLHVPSGCTQNQYQNSATAATTLEETNEAAVAKESQSKKDTGGHDDDTTPTTVLEVVGHDDEQKHEHNDDELFDFTDDDYSRALLGYSDDVQFAALDEEDEYEEAEAEEHYNGTKETMMIEVAVGSASAQGGNRSSQYVVFDENMILQHKVPSSDGEEEEAENPGLHHGAIGTRQPPAADKKDDDDDGQRLDPAADVERRPAANRKPRQPEGVGGPEGGGKGGGGGTKDNPPPPTEAPLDVEAMAAAFDDDDDDDLEEASQARSTGSGGGGSQTPSSTTAGAQPSSNAAHHRQHHHHHAYSPHPHHHAHHHHHPTYPGYGYPPYSAGYPPPHSSSHQHHHHPSNLPRPYDGPLPMPYGHHHHQHHHHPYYPGMSQPNFSHHHHQQQQQQWTPAVTIGKAPRTEGAPMPIPKPKSREGGTKPKEADEEDDEEEILRRAQQQSKAKWSMNNNDAAKNMPKAKGHDEKTKALIARLIDEDLLGSSEDDEEEEEEQQGKGKQQEPVSDPKSYAIPEPRTLNKPKPPTATSGNKNDDDDVRPVSHLMKTDFEELHVPPAPILPSAQTLLYGKEGNTGGPPPPPTSTSTAPVAFPPASGTTSKFNPAAANFTPMSFGGHHHHHHHHHAPAYYDPEEGSHQQQGYNPNFISPVPGMPFKPPPQASIPTPGLMVGGASMGVTSTLSNPKRKNVKRTPLQEEEDRIGADYQRARDVETDNAAVNYRSLIVKGWPPTRSIRELLERIGFVGVKAKRDRFYPRGNDLLRYGPESTKVAVLFNTVEERIQAKTRINDKIRHQDKEFELLTANCPNPLGLSGP